MEKTVGLEIKSAPSGEVEGYASLFNTVDAYGDAVSPGTFTATLADWKGKGRLPPMLWSHDQAAPIGAWTAMAPDSKGLHVRGRLASKGKAAEVRELVDMGGVDGASIGYLPVVEDYVDGVNHLREIRLFEISLCVLPALADARVAALKSFDTTRQAAQVLREVAPLSRSLAEELVNRIRALREPGTAFDVDAVTAALRQSGLRLPSR